MKKKIGKIGKTGKEKLCNNENFTQGKIRKKVHARAKRAVKHGLKNGEKRKNEEKLI